MELAEELRAIDAVRQLKARYFRFLDGKDWDGFATIFCRDASFDLLASATVNPDDGSTEAAETAHFMLHGRDAIVAAIRDAVGANHTVHHGHCHEVWVDSSDEARGVIAFEDLGFSKRTGELVMHGYGHYHEKYRREDGAWRILESMIPRMAVMDKRPR